MKIIGCTPLISLCIPTYNRGNYLKRCIESIIVQEEFRNGTVEIVISDNASDDNTQEIVREYAEKYHNIIYSRNEVNVRDKNFPIALGLGKGLLRKLCNDTLIFKPESIKYMCEIVKIYENDRPHLFWSNGQLENVEELKMDNFREFVLDASFWITSIACFSIWENECENIENDIDGVELLLWQVRKCLELCQKKDGAVIVNRELSKVQSVEKKNISYGLYNVFYINYFKLLDPYFFSNKLTANDREFLEKDLLFNFFIDWSIRWELLNRNFKYSEKENLKSEIKNQYGRKPYWRHYIKIYRRKKVKMKIMLLLKSLSK